MKLNGHNINKTYIARPSSIASSQEANSKLFADRLQSPFLRSRRVRPRIQKRYYPLIMDYHFSALLQLWVSHTIRQSSDCKTIVFGAMMRTAFALMAYAKSYRSIFHEANIHVLPLMTSWLPHPSSPPFIADNHTTPLNTTASDTTTIDRGFPPLERRMQWTCYRLCTTLWVPGRYHSNTSNHHRHTRPQEEQTKHTPHVTGLFLKTTRSYLGEVRESPLFMTSLLCYAIS